MLIRRYRRSDLGAVLELFHDTVHTIGARDYSQDQLDAWAPAAVDKEIWHERLSTAMTYVAEEYRILVGFGSLTSDGWIDTIYTRKSFQRRGVATAILKKLTEDAVAFHFPVVRVASSITAKRFFEFHGFSVDWEQEKAHHGNVFKGYAMVKKLPA